MGVVDWGPLAFVEQAKEKDREEWAWGAVVTDKAL